ncbi:DEAD/DEAH box helicase [Pseudomonas sp. Choline-3u-10]|jgi:ATP-dependent RNA helicase RhlE|uniref:DEAD/DEAH box helicase n=1 Tax=Pseudomonadaceae TaxID=135621 RepID=UPI000617F510|nr:MULTISPECIES: DEAD/DEAH box helicase [Pseudomonadaceae]MBU0950525.1 DEAD/DEAH box helicase [Gammaproteobacteria bacterium]KJJ64633.1 DEAD/DEAH box helicase [Pseudomonas sp. 10B238]MBK3793848.1 DEAD/DEAH box helicase [Stutzerimonas stutzeri]MBK3875338.1 DEAD/DEAH box helicase [Stutzerimonas stutzeri]PKG94732.1 DEAD/DEAH box helicase [Pseudomonas sp. Choline-3u-10]|tara:strand:- start:314 stop:2140 length:1827 start_codon:yes stop_codon:yes gene_type:complete
MSFASLGLSEALAGAVEAAGYTQPTPVQQRAIPAVLQGRDLMVAAQTGTGKTGGFALPVLEILFPGGHPDREHRHGPRQPRVLVLTPTRELAAQVHDSFKLYARDLPLKSAVIFGGVGMNPQVQAIAKGLDVLVACPGRLLDLANQKAVDLSHVEILVLDEADRMLDMGFIHDVKKVLAKLPTKRQNLLFSATFSKDITDLASKLLHEPEKIQVTPPNTTVERIEQRVFRLPSTHKRALLAHLITKGAWEQVLVFTRTKHGANRLAEYLVKHGLPAVAIHGNKSQNARTKALADFKANQVRILVATDIAARGLDIDQLPHVVNFELPNVEEDYVHRIGRTGRAGRSGEAISLVAPDEEKLLKGIERMTKQKIPDGDLLGFDASTIEAEKPEVREPRQPRPARNSERKPRGERAAKTTETAASEPKAGDRNRRGRNKPRSARPAQGSAEQTAAAPVSRPPRLPNDRAPDEFLDDEVDNFGNSVDYVSPYQNKQGRGRRPGAPAQPAQPASQPRAAAAPRSGAASAGAQGKGKRQGQPARGAQPRRKNEGRRIDGDSGGARRDVAEKPKEKQPVIIHKESKLDRLPSIEQLEQLPTKPRGEKPALLTRNR